MSTKDNKNGEMYFQQIIQPIQGRFPVMNLISSANLFEENTIYVGVKLYNKFRVIFPSSFESSLTYPRAHYSFKEKCEHSRTPTLSNMLRYVLRGKPESHPVMLLICSNCTIAPQ